MDLTRSVGYRGFALNTITRDTGTSLMRGCEIRSIGWGGVPGVGYDEKRALADGRDVSDITLDGRTISLAGNLYGRTRGEFFDSVQQLLDVLTPTDAYEADTANRGFWPLDFYVPSADLAYFPTGVSRRQVYARPTQQPRLLVGSDTTGGIDGKALALPWDGQLLCRDPLVYSYDLVSISPTGASRSGTFVNKGNRPSPLHVSLQIPASLIPVGQTGVFDLTAGGAAISFYLPSSTSAQEIRYNAYDKVVELHVGGASRDLRMDLLVLHTQLQHPRIAPGSSAYSWALNTKGGGASLDAASYIRYRDAWA